MIQFFKQNKQLLIITIISLSLIGSLGVEAGYIWDPFNQITIQKFSLNSILSLSKPLFNLLRTFSPIACFLFMIIYFLSKFNNFKKNLNLSIIIFLIYSVAGVLGYFINIDLYGNNKNFEMVWRNTYLGIQSIVFFSLLLLLTFSTKKNFENYLKLTFLVITFVYCYFSYLNLANYFFEVPNYDLYATDYNVNGSLLGYEVPRSSGISRFYLLVVIAAIIYLFNYKKINYNLPFLILLPLIISLIFLLNSRVSILSLFFMTFLIFLFGNKNFLQKILLTLTISFLAYICLVITPKIKSQIFYNAQFNKTLSNCGIFINEKNIDFFTKKEVYENFSSSIETSGCSDEYKSLIENKINNKIFLYSHEKKLDLFSYFFVPDKELFTRRINADDISKQIFVNKKREKIINKILNSNNDDILTSNNDDLKNNNISIERERLYELSQFNKKNSSEININSNNVLLDYLIKKSKEELSTETLENLKAQKKQLEDLYKNTRLSEKNRILVVKKLEETNNLIKFAGNINNCPYKNTEINKLLTGRLCHWFILLDKTGLKIFGGGPKFDRTMVKWGASSGAVYSYVTSGIFGIVFYLYITIKFIFFSIEILMNRFNKNFKIPIINQVFFMILLFFMIRSIIEVSFAYWGVDQLLFLSIFIYYDKFIYRKTI